VFPSTDIASMHWSSRTELSGLPWRCLLHLVLVCSLLQTTSEPQKQQPHETTRHCGSKPQVFQVTCGANHRNHTFFEPSTMALTTTAPVFHQQTPATFCVSHFSVFLLPEIDPMLAMHRSLLDCAFSSGNATGQWQWQRASDQDHPEESSPSCLACSRSKLLRDAVPLARTHQ